MPPENSFLSQDDLHMDTASPQSEGRQSEKTQEGRKLKDSCDFSPRETKFLS